MKNPYEIHCEQLMDSSSLVVQAVKTVSESQVKDVKTAYRNITRRDHSNDVASLVQVISERLTNENNKIRKLMQILKSASQLYLDAEESLVSKAMLGTVIVSKWNEAGVGAAKAYFQIELSPADKLALENGSLPILFTADTFKDISSETKEYYIERVETANPEYRELFDKVLADPDLTDAERRDIKFLAYFAPEPYRSLYLEHLRQYTVNVGKEINGSYYSPGNRGIYLTDSEDTFLDNPRGPYNTFYHESGHAIDDFEQNWGYMTNKYNYEGKSLHDYVVEDVRTYVEDVINKEMPELSGVQRQELLRSLNLTNDSSYSYGGSTEGLDAVMQHYRTHLINMMRQDLNGNVNEAPSDVYGGVTNNAIYGGWGHFPSQNSNPDDYHYWYDSRGTAQGSQERELWAEFFAAKMTHDEEALQTIRKHFPRAYDAMEEMAKQMART